MVEGSDRDTQDVFQQSKSMKSEVWGHILGFIRVLRGSSLKADTLSAKKCWKKVATNGGNTSNLLSHLRNHNPQLQSKQVTGNFVMGGTAIACLLNSLIAGQ